MCGSVCEAVWSSVSVCGFVCDSVTMFVCECVVVVCESVWCLYVSAL